MILLDTHVLIWYLTGSEEMSQTASEVISSSFRSRGVGIADMTLWEIAMLVERGRVVFDRDVRQWLEDLSGLPNFRTLPLSAAIATLSTRLPGEFHNDPADRLIVATAIDRAVPLVTRDQRIRDYAHVDTIW